MSTIVLKGTRSSRSNALIYRWVHRVLTRKRLIDALHCGPITTIEARRNLDILMPAARIHELKHLHGFDIQTVRVRQETDSGKMHSIAKYVLMAGA